MKKILLLIGVVALLLLTLFWRTFSADNLDIGSMPEVNIPENKSPSSLRITTLSTGKMLAKAGLAFRGGKFSDEREFGMGVALVDHPNGKLLIDAGLASNVQDHLATLPLLMRETTKIVSGTSVADQLGLLNLEPADLRAVILTHAHWDHVSGLADLPSVAVWVSPKELEFVNSRSDHTQLARTIGTEHYKAYQFTDNTYLGFTSSFDVFGDGSVVIVPASGHTPGAVIVFVTLANGDRYAFVGDLAWQAEGINLPAEKPWLARYMIGEDRQAVNDLLIRMHHLSKSVPNLKVIPSHDQRLWSTLPKLDVMETAN